MSFYRRSLCRLSLLERPRTRSQSTWAEACSNPLAGFHPNQTKPTSTNVGNLFSKKVFYYDFANYFFEAYYKRFTVLKSLLPGLYKILRGTLTLKFILILFFHFDKNIMVNVSIHFTMTDKDC